MSERVKQAIYYCEKYGQGHIADYMKPIYSEKSLKLAEQILKIDLKEINNIYKTVVDTAPGENDGDKTELTPPKAFDVSKASSEEKKELEAIGYKAICDGNVAAITMAGGQGSRLGHSGPKGSYVLNCNPPKSLFEIQSDCLVEIRNKTGRAIPWLIMTSSENHVDTLSFFEENDYFGYERSVVRFFPQSMLPVIDFAGKIIICDNQISLSPNGNGGLFSSLESSGNLKWLKEMGVRQVFICGIDNALVKVCDPVFIGFSIKSCTDISSKSTLKRKYNENAGVFCRKNNRPSYVEYTEISEEQARATDTNGDFLFGDIGIVMYVYKIDILERIADNSLPYHQAQKVVPYQLPDGSTINPQKPNAIKFETFIFDSFELADDVSVIRIKREEEFAPVKNSKGDDSPETAISMYNKYFHLKS